jgi:hypothetical protein
MPVLTVKWHTHPELRQTQPYCDICDSLNGAEWTFDTEKQSFPQVLAHPKHGIVWDMTVDDSRAHGSSRLGCYCTLELNMNEIDLAVAVFKLRARVQSLRDELRSKT